MNNATIYSLNAEIISEGLESPRVSDLAFDIARDEARERGESVVVEYEDTFHLVTVDGEIIETTEKQLNFC